MIGVAFPDGLGKNENEWKLLPFQVGRRLSADISPTHFLWDLTAS